MNFLSVTSDASFFLHLFIQVLYHSFCAETILKAVFISPTSCYSTYVCSLRLAVFPFKTINTVNYQVHSDVTYFSHIHPTFRVKVCRQKITEGLQVFTIASSDVSFYFIFCSSVMSFVLYSHLFICCLYITSCYSTLSLFVLILMLVLRLFHVIQTYVLRFDKNAMKSFHIVSNLWACIPVHIILNGFKHLLVTQSKSDYKR